MKLFYAISNPHKADPCISIRKEKSELLAYGERGQILPIFSSETNLRNFLWAGHRDEYGHCGVFPVGPTFFDIGNTIRSAVRRGKIETLVFDPIVDSEGKWVGEALEWNAKKFCGFTKTMHSVVVDMARRDFDAPYDEEPSPETVNESLSVWLKRGYYHLTGHRI